ncbi:MAG: hypothetical protein ACI8QY_000394, partial [bacterium]
KNSSLGVSEKLRQMTQQTSLSFIQIINGKKSNIDDIFSSSNTGNSYSSSSKVMIDAQRMIDAYSANQI